jgi:hypothetical protein
MSDYTVKNFLTDIEDQAGPRGAEGGDGEMVQDFWLD